MALLRDRRGAASLRYRNRAEVTVLMCEQKLLSGMVFVPAQKLSSIVNTALVEIRNDDDVRRSEVVNTRRRVFVSFSKPE